MIFSLLRHFKIKYAFLKAYFKIVKYNIFIAESIQIFRNEQLEDKMLFMDLERLSRFHKLKYFPL